MERDDYGKGFALLASAIVASIAGKKISDEYHKPVYKKLSDQLTILERLKRYLK